jgi:hypothetical protein
MKTPSEQELKETNIGKLVNKITKMPETDDSLKKCVALAREIVEAWKNACKQEAKPKPPLNTRSRSRSPLKTGNGPVVHNGPINGPATSSGHHRQDPKARKQVRFAENLS